MNKKRIISNKEEKMNKKRIISNKEEKMNKKRIISFLLALVMILGTFSPAVLAEEADKKGLDTSKLKELKSVEVNGRKVFYGDAVEEEDVIDTVEEIDLEAFASPIGVMNRSAEPNHHIKDPTEWPGDYKDDVDSYRGKLYKQPLITYWNAVPFDLDKITILVERSRLDSIKHPENGIYKRKIEIEIDPLKDEIREEYEIPDVQKLIFIPDPRVQADMTVYYDGQPGGGGFFFSFTGRAHTGIETKWFDVDSSKRPDNVEARYKTGTNRYKFNIPNVDKNLVLRQSTLKREWLDREVEYMNPPLITNDGDLTATEYWHYERYYSYIEDGKTEGEIEGKNGAKYLYSITGVKDPQIHKGKNEDGTWKVTRNGGASGFSYQFRQKLNVNFNSGSGTVEVDGEQKAEQKLGDTQYIGYGERTNKAVPDNLGFWDETTGNVSQNEIVAPSMDKVTAPEGQEFVGWSIVKDNPDTKIDLAKGTLVNGDIFYFTNTDAEGTTLYALYKDIPKEMVSITVATADTTNSTAKTEGNPFEVVKGSKFSAIEKKATDLIELNTGYAITGWQVDNAAIDGEKEFNADTTVTAQIGPKTDYSYTVKHLKENTTESLAAEETVENQKFGETITVRAKTDIAGYDPVKAQETITIGEGENVVTFYYREKTKVEITYAATEGGKVDPVNELLNPDLGEATGSEASLVDKDGDYAFVNWTTGSGEQLKKVSEAEKFVPTKPENGPWEAVTYTANFKKKAVETVPKGDEDYYVPVTISAGEHGGFDPAGNKTVHVLKGKATAADAFKLANLDIVKNEQGTAVGLNVDPGWSFVNYIDGQGVAVNPGAIINAEVGYTAKYKEKDSVTITYEAKPVDGKAVGKVTLSHENLKPATDTEAKGSAARVINLDYAFINWTDQANTEVSNKPGFKPTRPADGIWKEATYTANFKKKAVTENPKDGAYVEVTINSGDKGVFKADSSKSKTVHVLKDIATVADAFKEAKLDISGQDIKIDDPYSVFDQYKDQTDNHVNADTQIGEAITITAHYKDSVVVVPDQNKPGDPKAGYIKVEFKPVENGTISADRIFFVKQNATLEEAKDPKLSQKPLVVPAVSPKAGYKHVGWKEAEEAVAAGKQKLKALFPAPSIKVSADKTYNTQLTGYGPFVKNVTFEALYSKVTTAVDKGPTLPIYLNWKDIQHFVAKPVAKAEPKVEPAAPQLTVKPAPVPATGESRAEAYTISAVLLAAGLALLLLRRYKR